MDFQLNINQAYLQEFLNIVNSMKTKGIVNSFHENTIENSDIPTNMEELMEVIEQSREDIKMGRVHTLEEVRKELLEDF